MNEVHVKVWILLFDLSRHVNSPDSEIKWGVISFNRPLLFHTHIVTFGQINVIKILLQ